MNQDSNSQEGILHQYCDVTITKASPKSGDNDRRLEFVISDNTMDRHGTIIPVSSWDLTNYNKNGIVAYQHKTNDIDTIIGKGQARIEDGKLIGEVEFEPADINPLADKVYKKLLFGSLKATSVGFRSQGGHWGDKKSGENDKAYYFDKVELMEFSIVNIPSNPNALKRSYDDFLSTQKNVSYDTDTTEQISAERARHIYLSL